MAVPRLLRSWRFPVLVTLGIITVVFLYPQISTQLLDPTSVSSSSSLDASSSLDTSTTAVVVAALTTADVAWIDVPSWEVWKYEVDNPAARHKIPRNKGNEATVYLTHIIDQYDNLTDRLIFMHSERYQWHNDDPKYDAKTNLRQLQLGHVDREGYVSLRCHWFQGCPAELKIPINAPKRVKDQPTLGNFYAHNFPVLFPNEKLPEVVAAGCCSQFAVTSTAIRKNSRDDYVRIRQWLLDTTIPDYMSGRVLEYSWHILFGKQPVHCPSTEECYCKTYERCELDCVEGDCGQYLYPFGISWFKTVSWKLGHLFTSTAVNRRKQ